MAPEDFTPGTALPYRDLLSLSDEQLIQAHDLRAKGIGVAPQSYLNELHRRYQQRHSDATLHLTRCIAVMTAAVLVATLVNVVLAVVP